MLKHILACAFASGLAAFVPSVHALTASELAFHHAPVHYQDTDSSDYASDYLTAFDYDFDTVSTNNWDNRGNGLWPATAYYSVVESCTHYFITYAFYHPRDWSESIFDTEHENDLEGTLMAVRKDGTPHGTLEGMVTVFHTKFFSYTPPGSPYLNGHETIDGQVSFENDHGILRAKTVQEAKGHGLKAWPYASDFNGAANQDGVVYYPTLGAGGHPSSGNDRHVMYRLVDLTEPNGMWELALRDAIQPAKLAQTFAHWGTFKGDGSGGCGAGLKTCSTNSANTPWGWDDGDDGATYRGEFALDPAHLFSSYFGGLGNHSLLYLNNPYLSGLARAGFSSSHKPEGFPGELDLDAMYRRVVNACH